MADALCGQCTSLIAPSNGGACRAVLLRGAASGRAAIVLPYCIAMQSGFCVRCGVGRGGSELLGLMSGKAEPCRTRITSGWEHRHGK